MSFETIFNIEVIAVALAWFGIIIWIFRPKSAKRYKEYSAIPLNDEYEPTPPTKKKNLV